MSDQIPPSPARSFLSTGAKLGAVVRGGSLHFPAARTPRPSTINVALIGCGEQGRILTNAALKIPGLRFKGVCDIWGYNRTYAERLLKRFGHEAQPFEDYREMPRRSRTSMP
jgi:hypothetical protein